MFFDMRMKNANKTDISDRPKNYFKEPCYEMIAFIPENAKRILDVGFAAKDFLAIN